MKIAYVDTSCFVAIAFGERGGTALDRRLIGFDELVPANLLEAELRAAFVRERADPQPDLLAGLSWVMPDRPLHAETAKVLQAGYVHGADCWHLATALYLAHEPDTISFLTLDERQRSVARILGFQK